MKRLALVVTGDCHATEDRDVELRWAAVMISSFSLLLMTYGQIVLLHGACGQDAAGGGELKGIDAIADRTGRSLRPVSVVPVPARWASLGFGAGPFRNGAMLEMQRLLAEAGGYDRLTLAYHDDLDASKGTRDTVTRSMALAVPTYVIASDGTKVGVLG